MQRYGVIGYDAQDQQLFDERVEASNRDIAHMMVLAQLRRNFATAPFRLAPIRLAPFSYFCIASENQIRVYR